MAGEDRQYVRWIHTLGCLARDDHRCQGPIEAHHAGDRGLSQRAHDRTAIPLCLYHHRCWHDHSGWCRGWDRARRREWTTARIVHLARAWEAQLRLEINA